MEKGVGRVDYNCDNCGIDMVIRKHIKEELDNGERETICCSRKCSDQYKSKYKTKENSPLYTRVEKVCQCCGSLYTVKNYNKDTSKFCSVECTNRYRQAEYNCDNCDKEMLIKRSMKKELEDGKRKSCCCSMECSIELRRKNKNKSKLSV